MGVTLLPIHVVAASLGLLSGYAALYAAKGALVHRKSGILFVCAMLTVSVTGILISAFRGVAPEINIPTALLTFYLVVTGLTTVRPSASGSRSIDVTAMVMVLSLGVLCFALALVAIARGGNAAGMAYPLIIFGVVAFVGGAGDRKMLRDGGLRGAARLKRHLWRMCFALFVASIAFLAPNRLPAMFRILPLRVAGVLLPIVAMTYWLWRLRRKKNFAGIVTFNSVQQTAIEAK